MRLSGRIDPTLKAMSPRYLHAAARLLMHYRIREHNIGSNMQADQSGTKGLRLDLLGAGPSCSSLQATEMANIKHYRLHWQFKKKHNQQKMKTRKELGAHRWGLNQLPSTSQSRTLHTSANQKN